MHWGFSLRSKSQAVAWADMEVFPPKEQRMQFHNQAVSPFDFVCVGSGRPPLLYAASLAMRKRYGHEVARDMRYRLQDHMRGLSDAHLAATSTIQPQRFALIGFDGALVFDEEEGFEPKAMDEFSSPRPHDRAAPVDFYSTMILPGQVLTHHLRDAPAPERATTSIAVVHRNGVTYRWVQGFTPGQTFDLELLGDDAALGLPA